MDQHTPNSTRDIGHTSLHSSSIPPDKVPVVVPTEMTQPQLPAMAYVAPWNYLRLGEIESAGITWQEAQRLNALRMEYSLQAERQYVMHMQTLNFLAAKRDLLGGNARNLCAVDMNGVPLTAPAPIDFRASIPEFIVQRQVCKTRSTTERTGWRWLNHDTESGRHVAITTKELRFAYETYLYERTGDTAMPTMATRDQLFAILLHSVPIVEKSGLRILSDHEIPFTNGIYNILDGKFTPFTGDTPYFATFAMLCRFESNAPNPDVFDAVLSDMFNGNPELMQLAYEFIGALLAPGATLKRIYVFQGVSQGGKTRLAELILALLDEVDVYAFNTVSDIVNDDLVRDARDCRLVYIKEATKNKLSAKQISYLKGFADGGHSKYSVAFKMLLCTNYKLLTGDNDFLEPALENRFAILPFPRPMKNTAEKVKNFERSYFENEKQGIVLKALRAFGRVLQNGGQFSVDYPVNTCIEQDTAPDALSDEERSRADALRLNPPGVAQDSKFDQLVELQLELTDDINPALSAEALIQSLNACVPKIVQNVASLGRALKKHFGEALKTDRINGATCYNLRFRLNS